MDKGSLGVGFLFYPLGDWGVFAAGNFRVNGNPCFCSFHVIYPSFLS